MRARQAPGKLQFRGRESKCVPTEVHLYLYRLYALILVLYLARLYLLPSCLRHATNLIAPPPEEACFRYSPIHHIHSPYLESRADCVHHLRGPVVICLCPESEACGCIHASCCASLLLDHLFVQSFTASATTKHRIVPRDQLSTPGLCWATTRPRFIIILISLSQLYYVCMSALFIVHFTTTTLLDSQLRPGCQYPLPPSVSPFHLFAIFLLPQVIPKTLRVSILSTFRSVVYTSC
ncbi:hypothetical protein F5Y15DRAFT_220362 [Xylariaceae sp. FL0016]|nr:hypothetical protein F5Y15DRAFT_220362 [Xylariaceae sp. FL0016]